MTKPHTKRPVKSLGIYRRLGVVQYRHTGKMLSRPATSYPMLVMIILLVGVLLYSWTSAVSAAFPGPVTNSYQVYTRVPAPIPTTAATINSPPDGRHFSQNQLPVTVNGSCPVNSYIEIMRNNVFDGVALCDPSGNYQLSTDLSIGANRLLPQVYNITGDAGPSGTPVTVYYDAPVVSSNSSTNDIAPTGSGQTASKSSPPLVLTSDFSYQGYYTGQASQWHLDLSGGNAPYALSVDWGDGSHDLKSITQAGQYKLEHAYQKAGGYRGSYVVKFTVVDASGNQSMLQLLAIINSPPSPASSNLQRICLDGNKCSNTMSQTVSGGIRKLVWSGYGVVLLMALSFWLGERQELVFLSRYHKKMKQA